MQHALEHKEPRECCLQVLRVAELLLLRLACKGTAVGGVQKPTMLRVLSSCKGIPRPNIWYQSFKAGLV